MNTYIFYGTYVILRGLGNYVPPLYAPLIPTLVRSIIYVFYCQELLVFQCGYYVTNRPMSIITWSFYGSESRLIPPLLAEFKRNFGDMTIIKLTLLSSIVTQVI